MDYARFNYVAQPEDHLSCQELMPRIGVYDEWAIEWGYRWLPQLKTKDQEKAYMNQWIISSLIKDKRLWWGEFEPGLVVIVVDPRLQTEDLGDDAVKASGYGIKNLQRLMNHLTQWAVLPNEDYSDLKRMYSQTIAQYARYIMHVANNIGNKYWTEKKEGQAGPVVEFIPKVVQQRALGFLNQELFTPPEWLYNKNIFGLVGGRGTFIYGDMQKMVIGWLVNSTNYFTMSWAQMQQPQNAYSYDELLSDLEGEIWKELGKHKSISYARRNLQRIYVDQLLNGYLDNGRSFQFGAEKTMLDYYPLLLKHIQMIERLITSSLPGYKDEDTRVHLTELGKQLSNASGFNRFNEAIKLASSSAAPSGLNLTMDYNSFKKRSESNTAIFENFSGCNFWTKPDDILILSSNKK
jgi:hypothetical protein